MSDSPVIFYSWQSDTSKKFNQNFIQKALENAIKEYKKLNIKCEPSPRLDRDTNGKSGTPDIPATIFDTISSAAIFVADITFVGKTEERNEEGKCKLLPNPNVMLELGYAAHCLGWDRIILVMNKHFGDPENLPFDLRHRRFPLDYNLASSKNKSTEIKQLAQKLYEAISTCLGSEHAKAMHLIRKLTRREMTFLCSEKREYFPEENDERLYEIEHLLEKEIIFTRHDPCKGSYAYHWTYVGKLVRDLVTTK